LAVSGPTASRSAVSPARTCGQKPWRRLRGAGQLGQHLRHLGRRRVSGEASDVRRGPRVYERSQHGRMHRPQATFSGRDPAPAAASERIQPRRVLWLGRFHHRARSSACRSWPADGAPVAWPLSPRCRRQGMLGCPDTANGSTPSIRRVGEPCIPHRAASLSSVITSCDTETPARPSSTAASRSSRTGAFGQCGTARTVRCVDMLLSRGYQGRCRLSHSRAGPITGRSCQPCAITCPRTDSAAPRSCWRSIVA